MRRNLNISLIHHNLVRQTSFSSPQLRLNELRTGIFPHYSRRTTDCTTDNVFYLTGSTKATCFNRNATFNMDVFLCKYICSRRLCLEYLDLYLIHQPISLVGGGYDVPFPSDNLVPMDFKSVWEAMEECQILGLTKNIGVSNFSCQKLRKLLSTAKIPPAVNQVEMSPLWRQTKLREFCEENGILITAFSPLGARGTSWGTDSILDNEILKEITQLKGKTVAQVCLRWLYEQGVTIVVKSFNKARMKENISIFDWMLCPQDYELINQISERRAVTGLTYITENGPYKSIQEFWDGEI